MSSHSNIFYRHIRARGAFGQNLPTGGQTIGWIRDYPNDRVVVARAVCSTKDNYNRADGNAIVAARIADALKMTTEDIRKSGPDGFIAVIEGSAVRGLAQEAVAFAAHDIVLRDQTLGAVTNRFIESIIYDMRAF